MSRPPARLIDIAAAVDSVVDAATAVRAQRGRAGGGSRKSLVEVALALAIPTAQRSDAGTSLLDRLRIEPAAAAREWGCTLGAVLVWRAVDRAEGAGQADLAAAETGLAAALAYLDLVSPQRLSALGVDDCDRHIALAILELQARAALSWRLEQPKQSVVRHTQALP